ncbi:M15 family metallopeptidase [Weissella soli]|uniref:M15 family metallopeptidase n=1 Tax=Weissella soli TaxID=155866 RepID=UPI0021C003FB|nr:M15 family metallopeptidase [Weissella soli]MCT8395772.1 D-alanyl-D-alanine carboxypeptidase family protein [Weissella soli]
MKKGLGILAALLIIAAGGYVALNQHSATKQDIKKTVSKVKQSVSRETSAQKKYPIKIKTGTEAAKLLIVVNKKHPLPSDYNPYNGAVTGNNPDGGGLMTAANEAKSKLILAMQQAGFPIASNVSSFRYYSYQQSLYDGYVTQHGQSWADKYSARPGYSEHQSGMAFDLVGEDGDLPTSTTMYNWLKNHAYKYGLIIRYPKGKASITGYDQEQWHLRYIGVKYATEMHEWGVATLEEFTGISGGDYNSDKSADVSALDEYK